MNVYIRHVFGVASLEGNNVCVFVCPPPPFFLHFLFRWREAPPLPVLYPRALLSWTKGGKEKKRARASIQFHFFHFFHFFLHLMDVYISRPNAHSMTMNGSPTAFNRSLTFLYEGVGPVEHICSLFLLFACNQSHFFFFFFHVIHIYHICINTYLISTLTGIMGAYVQCKWGLFDRLKCLLWSVQTDLLSSLSRQTLKVKVHWLIFVHVCLMKWLVSVQYIQINIHYSIRCLFLSFDFVRQGVQK